MPRAAFPFDVVAHTYLGAAHCGTGARQPRMDRGRAAWSETGSDAITVSLQVSSWSHGLIESLQVSRSCSGRDDGDDQRGER
jgi:hypothetical protein